MEVEKTDVGEKESEGVKIKEIRDGGKNVKLKGRAKWKTWWYREGKGGVENLRRTWKLRRQT